MRTKMIRENANGNGKQVVGSGNVVFKETSAPSYSYLIYCNLQIAFTIVALAGHH